MHPYLKSFLELAYVAAIALSLAYACISSAQRADNLAQFERSVANGAYAYGPQCRDLLPGHRHAATCKPARNFQ